MAKDLILKVNDEPTIWNKEMAIGTLIFPVIGTIIGGYIGKSRMKHEKEHGRVVTDEPSFWNKDTLLGALLGGVVGRGAAILMGMAASEAFNSSAIGLAVQAVIGIGSTIIGARMGGDHGINRQKHDYEQAHHQQVEKELGIAMGRSQAIETARGKDKEFVVSLEQERGQNQQHTR